MSLNVSLPVEIEDRVCQDVESGRYRSASEVIREAVRLFEAYQGVRAASLTSLKADIAAGVDDIEASRVGTPDAHDLKRRGREVLAARRIQLTPVVRYTASAENDLLDAWLSLAANNQNAADCLIETVNQEATQLLAHPRDGSEAPGVGERHSDVANLDAISVVLPPGQRGDHRGAGTASCPRD